MKVDFLGLGIGTLISAIFLGTWSVIVEAIFNDWALSKFLEVCMWIAFLFGVMLVCIGIVIEE